MSAITRRSALAGLISALPVAAFASKRAYKAAPRERISVNVSPLRVQGDTIDANFLEEMLPGYLAQYVGPGHDVHVRIDSVTYGPPGGNGQFLGNGAVDSIEGVGVVDGREVPVFVSIQTQVYLPDQFGYAARVRQEVLARAFAQWLPRQAGL